MIQDPENLAFLLLFFVAIYWFFRWVVYDMNRPAERASSANRFHNV